MPKQCKASHQIGPFFWEMRENSRAKSRTSWEVNNRYYPDFEQPIGGHEKHYPLVWYILTVLRRRMNKFASSCLCRNFDNENWKRHKHKQSRSQRLYSFWSAPTLNTRGLRGRDWSTSITTSQVWYSARAYVLMRVSPVFSVAYACPYTYVLIKINL